VPKYGVGPPYELEASRITDDGTDISLPTLSFQVGDLQLDSNGTRIRLTDVSKLIELYVNRNDAEHRSTFAMGGSPGIATLEASDGTVVAELSLAPASSEVRLGFTAAVGVLRLNAATTYLPSSTTNIGTDANSQTAIVGTVTRNGVPLGTASYVQQLAQIASISPTDILIGGASLGAGLYRLSYYLVTTVAGTSGTVKATFDWTDAGAARVVDSATITFGTLADPSSGTLIIQLTGADPIRYSTTVAAAVGDPQYALYIALERLQ
jgi:hypothetical protein